MSAVASAALGRIRWGRLAVRHGWTAGVYVLLAVLLAVEIALAPLFTSFDLNSLFISALPVAFAAMGQAVVVISGGIDLSIGPLIILVNVVAAKLMLDTSFETSLLIAAALVAGGALAGAFTGTIVVLTRVPDIVVTLAMLFVWGGVALWILPTPGGGAPVEFTELFTGAALWEWIPNALLVIVVALVAVWLPLRRSRLGYALYAIGSSRNAAFLSGVNVASTRVAAYAVAGLFAALGGLALTAATATGTAQGPGQLYTLNSVAAIVLGGVSLLGGRGGLLGPVAAAFVFPIVNAILLFQRVDPNYGAIIQGTLIVLVVMIGGLFLLRTERR